MTQTSALLLSISVAITGQIPLIIVLTKLHRRRKILQTGTHTQGTVEHVTLRRGYKGRTQYNATITFPANNGIARHRYPHFSARLNRTVLGRGNTITIIYNPRKPKHFVIQEVPQSKAIIIFTVIIAILYIRFGMLLYNELIK